MTTTDLITTAPSLAPADILARAISPWPRHCAGYPLDPEGGYVAAPRVVAVAKPIDGRLHPDDDDIVTFDLAEERAKIGQINCMPVHSFRSAAGLLCGVDLLPSAEPRRRLATLTPDNGGSVPVWRMDPVTDAGTALLTAFRPFPGTHCPCAVVHHKEGVEGPAVVGAVLAIGIPEEPLDPDDPPDATLFMEGLITRRLTSAADLPPGPLGLAELKERATQSAWSILAIGEHAGRRYREIYVGAAAVPVPPGSKGAGLVAIPYLRIPASALPTPPAALLDMTLPEWQASLA